VLVEGNLVDRDLVKAFYIPRLFLTDIKHPLLVFTSLLVDGETNYFEMIHDIEGLHIDNVTDLY